MDKSKLANCLFELVFAEDEIGFVLRLEQLAIRTGDR